MSYSQSYKNSASVTHSGSQGVSQSGTFTLIDIRPRGSETKIIFTILDSILDPFGVPNIHPWSQEHPPKSRRCT